MPSGWRLLQRLKVAGPAPTLGIMAKYERRIPQWIWLYFEFLCAISVFSVTLWWLYPAFSYHPIADWNLHNPLLAILKANFTAGGRSVTLDNTPHGATVRIISLESSDTVTLRLMEMGMVPGSAVRVVKSAPLGDPIQICIRNQHLALRRNEARAIIVSSE